MCVKDGGITDILSFIVHVYSVHVFIASRKQLCFPFGEGGGRARKGFVLKGDSNATQVTCTLVHVTLLLIFRVILCRIVHLRFLSFLFVYRKNSGSQ